MDGGQAWLRVDDACGGIDPQDLERVFEVAYRGSRARDDEGAGLGLAIARGLVQAHNATIRAADRGPGCRFEIHLPLAERSGLA